MRRKKKSEHVWVEYGRYYGYPECCIEAFCKKGFNELSPNQERVHKFKGFIPCESHSIQIINGEITLKDLIKNRVCPFPFPKEGDV